MNEQQDDHRADDASRDGAEPADGGDDDELDGQQHREGAGREVAHIRRVDPSREPGEGRGQRENRELVAADRHARRRGSKLAARQGSQGTARSRLEDVTSDDHHEEQGEEAQAGVAADRVELDGAYVQARNVHESHVTPRDRSRFADHRQADEMERQGCEREMVTAKNEQRYTHHDRDCGGRKRGDEEPEQSRVSASREHACCVGADSVERSLPERNLTRLAHQE
jgi:hypothetical protein